MEGPDGVQASALEMLTQSMLTQMSSLSSVSHGLARVVPERCGDEAGWKNGPGHPSSFCILLPREICNEEIPPSPFLPIQVPSLGRGLSIQP